MKKFHKLGKVSLALQTSMTIDMSIEFQKHGKAPNSWTTTTSMKRFYIHGKVLEGQISSISMEKFYKHQQVS